MSTSKIARAGMLASAISNRNLHLVGILFVLLYNTTEAVKIVYAANLTQSINPAVIVFSCFSIATIFLLIKESRWLKSNIKQIAASGRNIFWLNVCTASSWLTFFYLLEIFEPAIAGGLMLAIGPILTLIIGPILRKHSKVFFGEIIASIGILFTFALITYFMLQGNTAVGELSTDKVIYGIILVLIGGSSIVAVTIISKRLSEENFSPFQILTVRFFILIVASGIMVWAFKGEFDGVIANWPGIVAIALAGIVMPLYFLQAGIQKTEPIIIAIVISTAPCFTQTVQLFDKRLAISYHSLIGIGLLVFFVLTGTISRYRKENSQNEK